MWLPNPPTLSWLPDHVFVIAEAGVNHNGDIAVAQRQVDAAADAGADAIKFQTFKTERLVTRSAPKAEYQATATGSGESQFEMLHKLELSAAHHQELMDHCRDRGIMFLSTPFDEESADMLDGLDIAIFKVPSGEVTNLPYLAHLARKQRPIIMSTGMSTLSEVEAAVQTIEGCGHRELVLLHCTSCYPTAPELANLRAIQTLAHAFGLPVGYSDHTAGLSVAMAAVALGARIIEKHFTVDRHLPGPDQSASLEPGELATLIRGIREVEQALGDGRKVPVAAERDTAAAARKSLVVASDQAAGTQLTAEMLAIIRPGTGLPPAMLEETIGRTLSTDVAAGTVLQRDMLV
ncbi:MAG: N-acetylneuraminate synthase [Armatimonadetes bacterium]|nr:N-acetylneuraminate synthase [Armatimonadota bacterium]